MTITEAARQAGWLAKDPSTALCASLVGWEHPISREGLVLADLFDMVHNALTEGRVEPHWIRPTATRAPVEIDHAAVEAALRLTGHLPAA
jgi:hypothetical protein